MDVSSMAEQMATTSRRQGGQSEVIDPILEDASTPAIPCMPRDQRVSNSYGTTTDATNVLCQATPSEAFSYDGSTQLRDNAHQFWSQMSFMDDPNIQAHDWSWDDIDAILPGGSSVQNGTLDRCRI